VIHWQNRIIRCGFYLLFGVAPLLLTPWNYELFEYNKMMVVYAIAVIIGTAWIGKSILQKEFRVAKTPLDIPILLFVFSQFTSALFSIDPHVSWFGYYSRFNGGMWSVITYVLLYYAFLSNRDAFATGKENISVSAHQRVNASMRTLTDTLTPLTRLLKISLITAALVALYGVLERLGIDKHIWVQDVQNRVFSTLGQPNWLAAYLVALMPIAWAMVVNRKQRTENRFYSPSVFYFLLSVLFFTVLLFTRSRSGLLGFLVADVVFWGLVFARPPLAKNQGVAFSWLPITFHILFALVVFMNGTGIEKLDKWISLRGLQQRIQNQSVALNSQPTGPALETGGTESGVIRAYVWEGAINAWKSTPKTMAIGTGTETFAFTFYQFRPVGHNRTSEWDFLYNKAHNEYLNYLATTGIFGLGSYLLILGTFIFWVVKQRVIRVNVSMRQKKNADTIDTSDTLTLALFAGWSSVLVTNFFGFSVVVTQLMLFLFPAIIGMLSPNYELPYTKYQKDLPSWWTWLTGIAGLYVLIQIGLYWYADTQFARGYQLNRTGAYAQAVPFFAMASMINPNEPLYHDEHATAISALAVTAMYENDATKASEFAQQAITESSTAIRISPNNVNFLKSLTRVLYTLSSLHPAYNTKAIETLKQAALLSPNDPKIYYNLAILVGQENDTEGAIAYLLKAKTLKTDYRDAYHALYVFYSEKKQDKQAQAVLQEYIDTVNPKDEQFRNLLGI